MSTRQTTERPVRHAGGQSGASRPTTVGPGHFGRLVTAGLLLGVVWVAVYWWWPTEPAVSFASTTGEALPAATLASGPSSQPPVVVALPSPEVPGKTPRDEAPRADPSTTIAGVHPPEFIEHTIAQGETPESISRAYFASPAHADAILRANPHVSPTNLRVGRVIRVPKDPANIQGVASSRPAQAADHTVPVEAPLVAPAPVDYVVQKGDSLGKIAKRIYGDERLSSVLFEANRDQLDSPDKVRVGQVLRVPPKPKD